MVNQTKISSHVLDITQKYLSKVREAGIHVNQAIIYGSYAKGTATKWSDIDLCVVSDQFGKDYHDELVSLMHLTDKETVDIEPHPYHPNDLLEKWNPFAAEIRKYGINLPLP